MTHYPICCAENLYAKRAVEGALPDTQNGYRDRSPGNPHAEVTAYRLRICRRTLNCRRATAYCLVASVKRPGVLGECYRVRPGAGDRQGFGCRYLYGRAVRALLLA